MEEEEGKDNKRKKERGQGKMPPRACPFSERETDRQTGSHAGRQTKYDDEFEDGESKK